MNREIALSGLKRNGHYVDTQDKLIWLDQDGPGLKMWKLIDCLCNYFGFHWVRPEEGYGKVRKKV